MRKVQLLVSALLLVLLMAACAPKAAPAPQVSALAPATAASVPVAAPALAASAKPAWQEIWEKTLAAAKKERRVVVYTSGSAVMRTAQMQIAGIQGINGEVISGRVEELIPRVLAERRAGLYLVDIYLLGTAPLVRKDKPVGLLEPLDSALILPDVTDPELIKKLWYKGELPWADQGHTALATTLTAQIPLIINTNLVKPDEVKSWRDLLNPKWKGKLVFNDPTVSGNGQLAICVLDSIMGTDYVEELAKAEPIIIRDQRQQVEWLAHGKIAIVIAAKPELITEFQKTGAPIQGIVPAEGSWLSAGSTALGWSTKPADFSASKVFINLLLSKEGQTILAQAAGFQSARLDVSTAHLPPDSLRTEGGKYINAYTEDFAARREVTDKLAIKLFGPLVK